MLKEWSENKIKQKEFLEVFKSNVCLAMVEETTKRWMCINMNPIDITKPNTVGGGKESKLATINYSIPHPGIFAVIIHPVSNYEVKVVDIVSGLTALKK